MSTSNYLAGYAPELQEQVQEMIRQDTLRVFLQNRHPGTHDIRSDSALRTYTLALKNRFMKNAAPLSKVVFDNRIHVIHNALGTHSHVTRRQGARLKSKNEIRISTVFKGTSEAMLNMIVVHELAHLKEREHNKAFYQLCENMLTDYHQLEFELRLFLTHRERQSRQETI